MCQSKHYCVSNVSILDYLLNYEDRNSLFGSEDGLLIFTVAKTHFEAFCTNLRNINIVVQVGIF